MSFPNEKELNLKQKAILAINHGSYKNYMIYEKQINRLIQTAEVTARKATRGMVTEKVVGADGKLFKFDNFSLAFHKEMVNLKKEMVK